MTDKTLLHPGDLFPALILALTGGGTLRLPDDLAGHFSVILCYRGAWCPYCNAQLRAFHRSLDRFAEIGIVVAALSVDDEATTKNLIAKHGLQFPIGHSADARAVAAATGAFVNDDPVHLQSTGFILDPSGRVVISVYSSGAIGRLVPDDVIGLVRYLREHAHASQPPPQRPRLSASGDHYSPSHPGGRCEPVRAGLDLATRLKDRHETSAGRRPNVPGDTGGGGSGL